MKSKTTITQNNKTQTISSNLKSPEDLFNLLESLNIKVQTFEHEPVFTVAEGSAVKARLAGAHTKNLFLKNKKGVYYLVTMLDDKRLDLKVFEKEMGTGKLSFASDDRLLEVLGVEPGHVTPFSVIHETANVVTVILDKEMMSHEILNFHPLKNHLTSAIKADDLLKFLDHVGHKPLIMTLPKA